MRTTMSYEQAPAHQHETVQPGTVLTYMIDAISAKLHGGYKGANGCVGVLGGCRDASGPPFFAAMAALRAGVDIARIFTTESAAPSIRCFSPDPFVHPIFKESCDFPEPLTPEQHEAEVSRAVSEVEAWLPRLHVLVVGSGLGRDPLLLAIVERCIAAAKREALALVIDGDAIFLVARNPALVRGYRQCVITPNLGEYRRFAHALGCSLNKGERATKLQEVVMKLGGPTLLSKGPVDAIANTCCTSTCSADSALKRCSGQGDLLAGVLAALIPALMVSQEGAQHRCGNLVPLRSRAEVARHRYALGDLEIHHVTHMACQVARLSAARAFEDLSWALLSSDIIPLLGKVLSDLTANPAAAAAAPGNWRGRSISQGGGWDSTSVKSAHSGRGQRFASQPSGAQMATD